jgi:hypothetical protein
MATLVLVLMAIMMMVLVLECARHALVPVMLAMRLLKPIALNAMELIKNEH